MLLYPGFDTALFYDTPSRRHVMDRCFIMLTGDVVAEDLRVTVWRQRIYSCQLHEALMKEKKQRAKSKIYSSVLIHSCAKNPPMDRTAGQ